MSHNNLPRVSKLCKGTVFDFNTIVHPLTDLQLRGDHGECNSQSFSATSYNGVRLSFTASIPIISQPTQTEDDDELLAELGLGSVYEIRVALDAVESCNSNGEKERHNVSCTSFELHLRETTSTKATKDQLVPTLFRRQISTDGKNEVVLYLNPKVFVELLSHMSPCIEMRNILIDPVVQWQLGKAIPPGLSRDLEKVFLSDEEMTAMGDFTIECAGKVSITCHKFILRARSDILRAMLESDLREKRDNRLVIADVSPEIVKIFLEYLYTDRLPATCDQEKWVPLLDMSMEYKVLNLFELLSRMLQSRLVISNAAHLLSVAKLYNIESLFNSVMKFVSKYKEDVVQTEGFTRLREDYPTIER